MIIWDRKHIEKLMIICYQYSRLNKDLQGVKNCSVMTQQVELLTSKSKDLISIPGSHLVVGVELQDIAL